MRRITTMMLECRSGERLMMPSRGPSGTRSARHSVLGALTQRRDCWSRWGWCVLWGFDGQVRKQAVFPAGEPPVGVAEQVHCGRHQHGAQDERIEGDGGCEADAELGDVPLAGEREYQEYADHDGGRCGDDPCCLCLAGADGAPAVAAVDPFLVYPADQEYLVVHGQAEQDGQRNWRQERFDGAGIAQA